MGEKLYQDSSGSTIFDAKAKLSTTTEMKVPFRSLEKGGRDAASAEITPYQSIVGRFLYAHRLSSPVVGFYAMDAATKYKALKLYYIQA